MSSITQGLHHVGLAVSKLEETAAFFTELLGFNIIRRDENYPAVFVNDGTITLTLWQTQTDTPVRFNRKTNVGLHHLALRVETQEELNQIYQKLSSAGVPIEFAPEILREGPAHHMMCFEPSGIRVEFIWAG